MPLQNRVTPYGQFIATEARGTLMGNRGVLHNSQRQIVRPFRNEAWITCQLKYKNQRLPLIEPGHYTQLFFLDEATAFAAGHRPCAFCRRADFKRFTQLWAQANSDFALLNHPRITAKEMDRFLHNERLGDADRNTQPIGSLPNGVFVELAGKPGEAFLYHQSGLYKWQPGGYDPVRPVSPKDNVLVLTPPSIVRTFAAGYDPGVHHSAMQP